MKYLFCLLLGLCAILACKKPGVGGDAAIRGYIHVQKFNSTFTQFISEYPGKDVEVFIVFGDRTVGFDDRVWTDYNGNFEFPYLYEGKYRVYAYSKDSTLRDPSGAVPVIADVMIDGRKTVENIDTLLIFQVK